MWDQAPQQPVVAADSPSQPAPAAPPAPSAAAAPGPEPAPAKEASPRLSPEQAARLERYSSAGQRLLAERIAATRALLERAPDEVYAIELFTTANGDPARMERFLQRARDYVRLEELFVIPMEDAGQYRLRVVYGEFPTREEAAAAGKRLPPKYQEAFRTELRTFGELRGQIRTDR